MNLSCEYTLNSLSFSQIHFDFTMNSIGLTRMNFASTIFEVTINSLSFFREFSIKWLDVSRWLGVSNPLSFSRIHYGSIIYFANSQFIRDYTLDLLFFSQSTMDSLSILRIHCGFMIYFVNSLFLLSVNQMFLCWIHCEQILFIANILYRMITSSRC